MLNVARVMPGVRAPEGSGPMAQGAQAGAVGRSNNGLNRTRHRAAVIIELAGSPVIPGVRRRHGEGDRCPAEPGGR